MKIFKQVTLLLCLLAIPMLQAGASETAVAEEEVVVVPKAYTTDFEFVSVSLANVAPTESTLVTVAATKGSGETRGWFIGISETPHIAHHSSIPWWVFLSIAALILVPLERRITRSTQRFLLAVQH